MFDKTVIYVGYNLEELGKNLKLEKLEIEQPKTELPKKIPTKDGNVGGKFEEVKSEIVGSKKSRHSLCDLFDFGGIADSLCETQLTSIERRLSRIEDFLKEWRKTMSNELALLKSQLVKTNEAIGVAVGLMKNQAERIRDIETTQMELVVETGKSTDELLATISILTSPTTVVPVEEVPTEEAPVPPTE